jgi:hypothetical protein
MEPDWAKPWRASERPSESSELSKLAQGLDPVWVARVSRPPLGVCCDHLRFTECGSSQSRDHIDQLQRKLGIQFPETYQAFLLNYNAGLVSPPSAAPFDCPSECNPLVCFYPIEHTFRTAFETTPTLDSLLNRKGLSTGIASLAHSPSDLRLLYLGIAGLFRGKVYSDCTVKPEWLGRGYPPESTAPSLSEYLGGLTPKWARPRQHEYDI